MTDVTQQALSSWVPPDILVGAIASLVLAVFLMARAQWTKQTYATESLAKAVDKLAAKSDNTVTFDVLGAKLGELHDKINDAVAEHKSLVRVLDDRERRK